MWRGRGIRNNSSQEIRQLDQPVDDPHQGPRLPRLPETIGLCFTVIPMVVFLVVFTLPPHLSLEVVDLLLGIGSSTGPGAVATKFRAKDCPDYLIQKQVDALIKFASGEHTLDQACRIWPIGKLGPL